MQLSVDNGQPEAFISGTWGRYIRDYPEYLENGLCPRSVRSHPEFAGRFGQWSFAALSAPIMVTNHKTGVVLGYFVSAAEFEEYLKVRDLLPKAGFAWEMPTDLADELEKPLTPRRPSSTR